jgi:hypothetical protein
MSETATLPSLAVAFGAHHAPRVAKPAKVGSATE